MKKYRKYEDFELLVLIREEEASSRDAFEELWDRYKNSLWHFCLYKTCDPYLADDLFQETWIRFYNNVTKGKNVKNVKKYLFKIALNTDIKQKKKDNRIKEIEINNIDLTCFPDELNLVNEIENKDIIAFIISALELLDDHEKNVFKLQWFYGFSISDITDITGDNYNTVRKRGKRGLEKVLKTVSHYIEENINKDR